MISDPRNNIRWKELNMWEYSVGTRYSLVRFVSRVTVGLDPLCVHTLFGKFIGWTIFRSSKHQTFSTPMYLTMLLHYHIFSKVKRSGNRMRHNPGFKHEKYTYIYIRWHRKARKKVERREVIPVYRLYPCLASLDKQKFQSRWIHARSKRNFTWDKSNVNI